MEKKLFSDYKIPLIFAAAGVGALILAVVFSRTARVGPEQNGIEIIQNEEATVAGKLTRQTIFVDIEGAVGQPGVYEMKEGSRVADLLEKAGGLSKKADFAWAAKNINRAKKLGDGEKIYIPFKGEIRNPKSEIRNKFKTNINTASRSELESFPGIGVKTAEKIIAGRPYSRIEELLEKKIVGRSIFEKIKEKISVF